MRVIVIGGGAAGMSAASRVKRLLGDRAEVIVFEKGRWVSFALCGTPYYIGCYVKNLYDLVHYPLEEFTRKRRIRVELNTTVTAIDKSNRVVEWQRSNGETGKIEYDYLVIATGAKPIAPPEWLQYSNVFVLHSLDDAERIRRYLTTQDVRRVVIVGSGYIGFELSETIKSLGKDVVVVEALNSVLPRMLDEDMSEEALRILQAHGVNIRLGSRVVGVEGESSLARRIVLDNGESIDADAVIVAIGIRPNTDLAKTAGLKIGETGAVWVDDHMRTSDDGIYAVGDVVETTDLVTGERVWMPLAPAANKMGYVAGSNIAGREARFPGVVRTSVTMAFNTVVAATGLREKEANEKGYEAISVKVEARTKAAYSPVQGRITLKIIADASTGRLLGAQAIGSDESVLWRINVVAALLHRKGTIWDLFYGDWGYMPLLAPVWDPLVIAGRLLMRKLGENPDYAKQEQPVSR